MSGGYAPVQQALFDALSADPGIVAGGWAVASGIRPANATKAIVISAGVQTRSGFTFGSERLRHAETINVWLESTSAIAARAGADLVVAALHGKPFPIAGHDATLWVRHETTVAPIRDGTWWNVPVIVAIETRVAA